MSASSSAVERAGNAPRGDGPYAPARRDATRVQIVSPPFSFGTFALSGLVLFAAAFVCGRYLEQLDAAAAGGDAGGMTVAPAVAATSAAPAGSAAPAVTTSTAEQPKASKVVTVTIRLMKFSPEQIEISAGDTIEWKNADLTPHTATARTKGFDSGPINPTASWRQTFAKPGSIPYVCTFHPDMRGVVVVK